jgi:Tol biopolymer transport system component
MALAPGTRLGSYEVVAPIGAGGMGEVYRARDTKLDRDVALKVLPEAVGSDPVALARFESEAKALAALSNPHILAIHDFGRIGEVSFVVSELLEGGILRNALEEGPLPVRRALEIAEKVAQGLAAAHEKGIVHRDLKPENVFLTADGNVKILDFGLARRSASAFGPEDTKSPTLARLTDPGVVFGTVAYMSPEQARGAAVDVRSDQFSFGTMLYELLAGERPFHRASPAETIAAILREEPEPLERKAPSVPAPVRWLIERCLSKEPSERYVSTRDLARDLTTCRQHFSETMFTPAPAAPVKRAWRSSAVLAVGLVSVAALAYLAGRLTVRPRTTGGDATAAARSFRRLTNLPGAELWPAISPDGETLAYVKAVAPGNADIFVQRIGGQAAVNLTKDSPGNDLHPAFSPDGSRIAFRSDRDGGGLFVMGTMGESVRRLTDFGFHPAWFPDGRKIVFSSRTSRRPYDRSGTSELWTVDVGTGEKRKLLSGDAEQPSVSPHGLRIAYWGVGLGGSSSRDVFTIPAAGLAEGEAPVPVTNDPALDWNPFWSADGRFLYFGSDRDRTLNLWRVPIDERSGRPVGVPEPVSLPAWHAGPFAASADGKRIAFQSIEDEFALEKIPLDPASGKVAGEPQAILKTNMGIVAPVVSPRGDAIAFASIGLEEDLWIIRSDGTGLRKVTDDRPRDRVPSFSPDGKRLVFHSDRDGFWNIWTIGVDGSGLSQLTADRTLALLYPVFSPDGTKLTVSSYRTGPRIIPSGARPDTPLPEPLPPPEKGFLFVPISWFPDGQKLAGYLWEPEGVRSGILSYDIASRTYERLTESGTWPLVSGDGRRLFYRDQGNIFLLDLATKRSLLVFEGTADRPVAAHTVARDGGTLYVIRRFDQSDIWLLDLR